MTHKLTNYEKFVRATLLSITLQLLQQNHSDADALQASAFGKVSHG